MVQYIVGIQWKLQWYTTLYVYNESYNGTVHRRYTRRYTAVKNLSNWKIQTVWLATALPTKKLFIDVEAEAIWVSVLPRGIAPARDDLFLLPEVLLQAIEAAVGRWGICAEATSNL